MKIILPPILFLLIATACSESPEPTDPPTAFRTPIPEDSIQLSDFPPGVPLNDIYFSSEIDSLVETGRLRSSLAANHYLQLGRYERVKRTVDEVELEWKLNDTDPESLTALDAYQLRDAKDYILDRAEDHRVLIVAEAHTKPEHRVFTRCLLEGLYDRGYRHLGLEGLLGEWQHPGGALADADMNVRGYPTLTVMSGIYTGEPEFANLIREAHDLGFTLFSYERNGSSESERDQQQAERIIEYMKGIPAGEKVICHGGWYHAIEAPIPKGDAPDVFWMAYEYRLLADDDPLTVYQDAMNDKLADNQKSSPYYEHLRRRLPTNAPPQVLIDEDTEASWTGPNGELPFDIITVEGPMEYTTISPWADWDCGKCTYRTRELHPDRLFPDAKPDEKYLLEIRRAYESALATPVFIRELAELSKPLSVRLCEGPYGVLLRSGAGDTLRQQVTL